jgi:hypothetical protein
MSMQRTTVLLLLACAALVGAQLSGVHAHLDAHGFDGDVQSTLEHHHDDGDDHEGDVDVQVVDLGMGVAKAVCLLLAVTLSLFMLPLARGEAPPEYKSRLPLGRRLRWRPPLRGPPRSISIS